MDQLSRAMTGLSLPMLGLALISLRNHSGWNFEIDGTASAIRGNKVRAVLVLGALQLFASGVALRPASLDEGRRTIVCVAAAGLLWLTLVVVLAAFRVETHPVDAARGAHADEVMAVDKSSWARLLTIVVSAATISAATMAVPWIVGA